MGFRIRPGSRALARPARDDSGFSLAEVIVALFILSGTFIALNAAIFGGMQATAVARQSQQASDLATQALETQRAVPENLFGAIAMRATDLTGDSRLVSCMSVTTCISPGRGLAAEPLVLSATGTVSPYVVTPNPTTRNGTIFTVSTYISTPPVDPVGASYKRITVFVTWKGYGKSHSRTQSTLLSDTRRGLPLPRFKLVATPTSLCKNPGNTAVIDLAINNLGARDSWDIYQDTAPVSWAFYLDVDNDGAYTSGTDTALVDTNTNGYGESGSIDPNDTRTILAVYTIPSSATASVTTYTFHAQSFAQPLATTAIQSKPVSMTVQTAACAAGGSTPPPTATATPTGSASCPTQSPVPVATQYANPYTLTNFFLHNGTGVPAGNTTSTASTVHTVSGSSSTSTTLYDYSTNIETNVPGLQVTPGSSGSFTYTYAGNNTLQVAGIGALGVWAQPRANGSTSPGSFTVTVTPYIFASKSATTATAGTPVTASYSAATWGCNLYRQIVVSLDFGSGFALSAGDYYTVTLGVPSSAPGNMLFAYDTSAYDDELTVSTK